MSTETECVCCSEISQVVEKKSSEGVECITQHPGFQSVCLNPWVLQTAYYSYRQQYGESAVEGAINEYVKHMCMLVCALCIAFTIRKYRHVAYRQLTRWCWHWLGRSVRVVLPSCAVTKIPFQMQLLNILDLSFQTLANYYDDY